MKSLNVLLFIGTSVAAYAIKPSRNYIQKPDAVGLAYAEVTVITHEK